MLTQEHSKAHHVSECGESSWCCRQTSAKEPHQALSLRQYRSEYQAVGYDGCCRSETAKTTEKKFVLQDWARLQQGYIRIFCSLPVRAGCDNEHSSGKRLLNGNPWKNIKIMNLLLSPKLEECDIRSHIFAVLPKQRKIAKISLLAPSSLMIAFEHVFFGGVAHENDVFACVCCTSFMSKVQ